MKFSEMKKSELIMFLEDLYCSEERTIALAPKNVAAVFRSKIGFKCKQENFVVSYLDGANKVMETKVIFVGTANRLMVHPREVFAPAFELRASSIIIGHNHPSGNTEPSVEDILMTRKLQEAGEILGIELLDHIVFTDTEYYSFQGNGKMPGVEDDRKVQSACKRKK